MATKKAASKKAASKRKAPTTVSAMVNGTNTGSITPGSATIGEAANTLAKDHGLKAFTILVDGVKVGVAETQNQLAGHSTLEVFAKETRG